MITVLSEIFNMNFYTFVYLAVIVPIDFSFRTLVSFHRFNDFYACSSNVELGLLM